MTKKALVKLIIHRFGRLREFQNKKVAAFAKDIKGKRILEIGSGKKLHGKYHYSIESLFDPSNSFIKTDINKEFGHKVLDVTKMDYKQEYDIIVCLNVLEHVYEYEKAISNIKRALKPKGIVIIAVPVFYPWHDEPHDYWRFTEHSLRKLLADFSKVDISYKGKREFPLTYLVKAEK